MSEERLYNKKMPLREFFKDYINEEGGLKPEYVEALGAFSPRVAAKMDRLLNMSPNTLKQNISEKDVYDIVRAFFGVGPKGARFIEFINENTGRRYKPNEGLKATKGDAEKRFSEKA